MLNVSIKAPPTLSPMLSNRFVRFPFFSFSPYSSSSIPFYFQFFSFSLYRMQVFRFFKRVLVTENKGSRVASLILLSLLINRVIEKMRVCIWRVMQMNSFCSIFLSHKLLNSTPLLSKVLKMKVTCS